MIDDLTLNRVEREVVRWAFICRFNEAPSVHEGLVVKRWATGPNKGKPKVEEVRMNDRSGGLLERGLITIEDEGHWPRAKFTDRGLRALKLMAMDRRALDPDRHRRLIQELAEIPGEKP